MAADKHPEHPTPVNSLRSEIAEPVSKYGLSFCPPGVFHVGGLYPTILFVSQISSLLLVEENPQKINICAHARMSYYSKTPKLFLVFVKSLSDGKRAFCGCQLEASSI